MGSIRDALEALNEIVREFCHGEREPSPIDLKLFYMDIVNSLLKTAMEVRS